MRKASYGPEGGGRPGTAFGSSGEGFIRCSYAYSIDNINEAIKRIRNFLKEYEEMNAECK